MQKNLKLEIETGAKDLVERIREYSRSQVELWQQVPLLAREAKRIRTEKFPRFYSYSEAISNNEEYWDLYTAICRSLSSSDFVVAPKLCLKTGELVATYVRNEPAPHREVLGLLHYLDELDAENVITNIKEEIADMQENHGIKLSRKQ